MGDREVRVFQKLATDRWLSVGVQDETTERLSIAPDGIAFGPGGSSNTDVKISRTGTGRLSISTGTLTQRVTDVTAASVTVTAATHANGWVTLNAAAGCAVTLPAASGTGDAYRFFIGTTVTSNTTTIKVANASDIMAGNGFSAADGGSGINAWETAADTDTVTFNGTTTGGIKGDTVELVDMAANLWMVRVLSSSTGTEATPFSATVS